MPACFSIPRRQARAACADTGFCPVARANANSSLARSFKICAVSYSFYVANLTGLLHKPNTSHLKEES